jgi:hypothetical protein
MKLKSTRREETAKVEEDTEQVRQLRFLHPLPV